MKTKEAMKIMGSGWIRRRKGFRVCFPKRVESEWVTDHFPDLEEKPLPSEVSAWELARRFAVASGAGESGEAVNIHVVDDQGNPVPHYGTNRQETLNPREVDEKT